MYGREQRIQKPSAKKLSVATDALLGGVLVAGIHVAVTVTKAVALSPFRPPAIGFFFLKANRPLALPALSFTPTCTALLGLVTIAVVRNSSERLLPPAFAFSAGEARPAGRLLLGAERHRPSTGDSLGNLLGKLKS